MSQLETTFNELKTKIKCVKDILGMNVPTIKTFSDDEKAAFDIIHAATRHNKGETRTVWLIDNGTFEQFKQYLF